MSREETLIMTVLALFLLSVCFVFCWAVFSSFPALVVSPSLEVLMVSRGRIQGIDTFRLLLFVVLPFLSGFRGLSP